MLLWTLDAYIFWNYGFLWIKFILLNITALPWFGLGCWVGASGTDQRNSILTTGPQFPVVILRWNSLQSPFVDLCFFLSPFLICFSSTFSYLQQKGLSLIYLYILNIGLLLMDKSTIFGWTLRRKDVSGYHQVWISGLLCLGLFCSILKQLCSFKYHPYQALVSRALCSFDLMRT